MHTPPSDNSQTASWQWVLCIVLLLATMLNYMDRQTLSQTATELKQEYGLTDARYGYLEAGFSWSFAVGSIFFGWLVDRCGPRWIYPGVLFGWSLAGMATIFASIAETQLFFSNVTDSPGTGAFRWLLLCRTVLGFCEAGHWPCALITIRCILTARDRPLGNGLLQSGASLGAILTPLVVQAIRGMGGDWRWPFAAIGIIGIFWIPVWWSMTRSVNLTPTSDLNRAEPYAPEKSWPMQHWILLVLGMAIIVITTNLGWQFYRAWLPKFLKEVHAYSEASANYFTSGFYIAADIGCLLAGGIVKYFVARNWQVHTARIRSFAVCALMASSGIFIGELERGPILLVVLLLVGAGTLGMMPHYYSLVQELPARNQGLISGTLAAMTWFAVGTMQGRIGEIIQETNSYRTGFLFVGLTPGVAFLAMLIVPRPRSA